MPRVGTSVDAIALSPRLLRTLLRESHDEFVGKPDSCDTHLVCFECSGVLMNRASSLARAPCFDNCSSLVAQHLSLDCRNGAKSAFLGSCSVACSRAVLSKHCYFSVVQSALRMYLACSECSGVDSKCIVLFDRLHIARRMFSTTTWLESAFRNYLVCSKRSWVS